VDIDSLREAMDGKWNPLISSETTVIVEDTFHLNGDLVEKLQSKFKTVRRISSSADATTWAKTLSGCSQIILSSSVKNIKDPSWAWLWLAPVGCKVLELQEEREPSDSLVHLAAASGLEWTLLQYPRSTPEGFKKIVEKEVDKWIISNTPKVYINQEPELCVDLIDTIPKIIETGPLQFIPTIYTPMKSMKRGFFGHAGDSFREMIDLWVEKGLVERKEDPSLTQCWLGAPGNILLYDRPTWQWLEEAPEEERDYRMCLAGNPSPSEKEHTQPWIFWPRQPRLIEELSSVEKKSYDGRADTMVFFGKIENDIQGSWRKDSAMWQSACAKFSMKAKGEPYDLNPREYLEALGNAKYGLCLRGYGPKCNREIELLAMGTVPVVTPDVDISNYMEPLIVGTHVLVVKDKADAINQIVYEMNAAKWLRMSIAGFEWWKRNCSVEGSWKRTCSFTE